MALTYNYVTALIAGVRVIDFCQLRDRSVEEVLVSSHDGDSGLRLWRLVEFFACIHARREETGILTDMLVRRIRVDVAVPLIVHIRRKGFAEIRARCV